MNESKTSVLLVQSVMLANKLTGLIMREEEINGEKTEKAYRLVYLGGRAWDRHRRRIDIAQSFGLKVGQLDGARYFPKYGES